jgi:hypothetical protein
MPMDTSLLFVRYVICTEPNKYTFEHNGGSFSNVYVTLEHRDTSGLLALKKMIVESRGPIALGGAKCKKMIRLSMDMSILFVRYVICTETNKYSFELVGSSFVDVYVILEPRIRPQRPQR